MNVKLGLPHEDAGGFSVALFGAPRTVRISKNSTMVYVDCHIVVSAETYPGAGYDTFEVLHSIRLSPDLLKKVHSRAKKMTIEYFREKGWQMKSDVPEYVQNGRWRGFMFEVQKK